MSDSRQRRDALRRSIDDDQEQLKQAIGQLKHAIVAEVSIGQRVARSPYRSLALAVAAGFVLGVWPEPDPGA